MNLSVSAREAAGMALPRLRRSQERSAAARSPAGTFSKSRTRRESISSTSARGRQLEQRCLARPSLAPKSVPGRQVSNSEPLIVGIHITHYPTMELK